MWMRAIKKFDYATPQGSPQTIRPGELVDIRTRGELARMCRDNLVTVVEEGHSRSARYGESAPPMARTLRVGCWIATSAYHSGGRIHLYQYASCLADAGAEVWIITNGLPRWRGDYAPNGRLRIAQVDKDPLPPDLDICMTDGKSGFGDRAEAYVRAHPWTKLVALNFETENWVAKYAPQVAAQMRDGQKRGVFQTADLLLAISRESEKYLREWLDGTERGEYRLLYPAVNAWAASLAPSPGLRLPDRPYAVWSARPSRYKRGDLAARAIWELDEPFDLAALGRVMNAPKDTPIHRLHDYSGCSDADKYALMRNAKVVLAPSLFEGFGLVPGEAMLSGTPTVAFDLPVLREVYGNRLIYAPWGNDGAYCRAVARAVKSAPAVPERDIAWVESAYGLDALKSRIEDLPWHATRRKRVSACMICYATPTAPLAIEAVYPHVDEVLVAYGPIDLWRDWPDDGTLDAIRAMPDPDGKIKIDARPLWRDKREMRETLAERVRGNCQLIVDADEIYVGLDRWLESDDTWFASPRWVHLWHGGEHWVHMPGKGSSWRWGARMEPYGSAPVHYRFSFWRPSYQWRVHSSPRDREGRPIFSADQSARVAATIPETAIYHLGHCLSRERMARKHKFYADRDRAPDTRRNAWRDWNGELGDCGDGVVERVTWELPEIVNRALAVAAAPERQLAEAV